MRTAFRILATRLWVWHAWRASGAVKVGDFIGRFDAYASPKSGYGLDPRLLRGWKRGKLYVSKAWVNRVEKEIPGTKCVHAIETLLKPERLSANAARSVVSQFFMTEPNEGRRWVIPYGGAHTSTPWTDSAALALRGDIVGFMAILALVREAFACTDYDRLHLHLRDMYTLLPSIAQLDWVRPDVDLLLQCIEDMMVDFRWSRVHIEIDWQAFRSEIENSRPWAGNPPWIVLTLGEKAESMPDRLLRRPVPLLEGIVPLGEFVRPQKNEMPQSKTPRRDSLFDRLMNRMESLSSMRDSL